MRTQKRRYTVDVRMVNPFSRRTKLGEEVLTQILQHYASSHPLRLDDGEEECEKIQCNEEQKIKLLEVS